MKVIPGPGPIMFGEFDKEIHRDDIAFEYQTRPHRVRITLGWVLIEGSHEELMGFFESGHKVLASMVAGVKEPL